MYQNLLRIESSKDRQETAILVFTVVNIIFLPLSFVSSFFGMNTADIRNLGTPQWIFWASALPLTAIVIGVSLFVAQKIEPVEDIWNRVMNRWRGEGVSGQPLAIPTASAQQADSQAPSAQHRSGPRRRPTQASVEERV